VVDPKGTNWLKYRGATLICPNEKEYLEAHNPAEHNLLVKLGAKGVRIEGETIPATAKQVFDVTGAGDTLVATVAVAIGAGATHKDAAILGNYAAGVTVGKLGTSICTIEELIACV
jgi:D-beta-D-heptose 7-phosphate kinase/D-beta-D-heptose 1-phosphate adenosyltransferase